MKDDSRTKEENEILALIEKEARRHEGILVDPGELDRPYCDRAMIGAIVRIAEPETRTQPDEKKYAGCVCLRCGGKYFAGRGEGFMCLSCGTDYEASDRAVLLLYGKRDR